MASRATAKTELFAQNLAGAIVIADQGLSTGNRFWVDSTTGADSAGYGRSPDKPFATLDYAIGNCTANKGDIIYILPGHSETFIATEGFDADVAGVKIVGLGWGSSRPTFHFTDTDSQVNIGANSVILENLRFVAGISAVVAGVQVEGKTDIVFRNCEWYWGGTTGWDFVIGLELEAGSHRARIEHCTFIAEPAVAGCAEHISFTGKSDNCVVRDCEFVGDCSTACVLGTAASEHLLFIDNLVNNENAGEPYLEVHAGTTGVIANTRGQARAATIAANAVAAAMAHCENFVCNTAGTAAILVGAGGSPVVDADAA